MVGGVAAGLVCNGLAWRDLCAVLRWRRGEVFTWLVGGVGGLARRGGVASRQGSGAVGARRAGTWEARRSRNIGQKRDENKEEENISLLACPRMQAMAATGTCEA